MGRRRCAHAALAEDVHVQLCLHKLRTAVHGQGPTHLQGCFHGGQRVCGPAAQGAQALLHQRAGRCLRQCPACLAPTRARPAVQHDSSLERTVRLRSLSMKACGVGLILGAISCMYRYYHIPGLTRRSPCTGIMTTQQHTCYQVTCTCKETARPEVQAAICQCTLRTRRQLRRRTRLGGRARQASPAGRLRRPPAGPSAAARAGAAAMSARGPGQREAQA